MSLLLQAFTSTPSECGLRNHQELTLEVFWSGCACVRVSVLSGWQELLIVLVQERQEEPHEFSDMTALVTCPMSSFAFWQFKV